jgi:thiol-disulfide isomerase/thioredoxin
VIKQRFITLALFCLCLAACEQPDYHDSHGNSGDFKDHQGHWMIINYWATWCKPCIAEIPELNKFAKNYSRDVVLFGVDYDQSSDEQLLKNSQQLGIEFTVLSSDPAFTLGYDRPNVLPTTLVFNPQGKLHRTLLGPQTEHSLQQAISSPK